MVGSPLLGLTLPTFTADGSLALVAAEAAEAGGLDGVFAFDHLWPMGSPGRPALWSFAILAAVAAAVPRIRLGPLVARIGLFGDEELVHLMVSLAGIAGPGRLVAGVGVGDRLSAEENQAYGVDYDPAPVRLQAAARVLDALRAAGLETWMGARSVQSVAIAKAHADALNVWGVSASEVHRLSRNGAAVTWAGQVLVGRDAPDLARLTKRYGTRPGVVTGTVEQVASELAALGTAGATWCVLAPLDYLAEPQRSVETVCRLAEVVR